MRAKGIIWAAGLTALILAGAGVGTAQESFLLGSSDIPLMPGLVEDEAAAVVFDKPSGRIMIARLGGCVDLKDARHFYDATLPQLGWLPAGNGLSGPVVTYLREDERLAIEFHRDGTDGKCLELRFLLSPAGAPQ